MLTHVLGGRWFGVLEILTTGCKLNEITVTRNLQLLKYVLFSSSCSASSLKCTPSCVVYLSHKISSNSIFCVYVKNVKNDIGKSDLIGC